MKVYECRYVRRNDAGYLFHRYMWRPAVLVLQKGEMLSDFRRKDNKYLFVHAAIEARMFDKETGENVGDTYNYCLNDSCNHPDCAPLTLIYED